MPRRALMVLLGAWCASPFSVPVRGCVRERCWVRGVCAFWFCACWVRERWCVRRECERRGEEPLLVWFLSPPFSFVERMTGLEPAAFTLGG